MPRLRLPRHADDDVHRPDDVAADQEDGPLDDIAKLAHVARPVMRREPLERARREGRYLLFYLAGGGGRESVRERGDVFLPGAERRQPDRKDVEAVEQVLPERAGLDERC